MKIDQICFLYLKEFFSVYRRYKIQLIITSQKNIFWRPFLETENDPLGVPGLTRHRPSTGNTQQFEPFSSLNCWVSLTTLLRGIVLYVLSFRGIFDDKPARPLLPDREFFVHYFDKIRKISGDFKAVLFYSKMNS